MRALDSELLGVVRDLDFDNGEALQHKIMKARSLFYLSEDAQEHGIMSFEEFEQTCRVGGLDLNLTNLIIERTMEQGRTHIEFLDYLS